jgi:hypothetical protein
MAVTSTAMTESDTTMTEHGCGSSLAIASKKQIPSCPHLLRASIPVDAVPRLTHFGPP